MFSYKSVLALICRAIFHTKHFSSPFSRGARRSSLNHADRNLRDNPLPILKFRWVMDVKQVGKLVSGYARVRIIEVRIIEEVL